MKLTDDDYISIYPLAKPEEIKEEFGELSHCVAQIRNKYRRLRFDTQTEALSVLMNELHIEKPPHIGFRDWQAKSYEELQLRKEAQFKKIRLRIQDRKRLYYGA
jgi:hypothetical protein